MSGIIFVVLAIGWAVYLLPKALGRHDDLDQSRPVEEFSESVRILGRGVAAVKAKVATTPTPVLAPAAATRAPVATITRESARKAARRRRRVLAMLLTTLAVVTVTSYLGYTPWYSTAIPGGLVVVFLVIARLTVRAQRASRVAPVEQADLAVDDEPAPTQADLVAEDTQGLSRETIADALAEPVLDEAGLWDPLPVTLPTYVNKARARRTVRTIEITAGTTGITSSGHDAADSALAADAREAAQQAATELADVDVETRKAAGA